MLHFFIYHFFTHFPFHISLYFLSCYLTYQLFLFPLPTDKFLLNLIFLFMSLEHENDEKKIAKLGCPRNVRICECFYNHHNL